MRVLPVLIALWPAISAAETYVAPSTVSQATIYAHSASIKRTLNFDVPAGRHELIIPDLPTSAEMETLRVEVEGARLIYSKLREDTTTTPHTPTAEYEAAEQAVHDLEDQIASLQDQITELRLSGEAAQAQTAFLTQLGQNTDPSTADPEAVRALSQMIGEETRRAGSAAIEGEAAARLLERQVLDLEEDLQIARQALDVIPVEDRDRRQVTVGIEAAVATQGAVTLSYVTYGHTWWVQVYDFYLDRSDAPTLTIERGVLVAQQTGENWTDVALNLSTMDPTGDLAPRRVWTRSYRLEDPAPPPPPESMSALAEPIVEAPVIVEESTSSFAAYSEGLAVSYTYGEPVDLISGAEAMRLQLDTLTLPAEIYAAATETSDDTAFLMARITNTSGEELLAIPFAARFLNGAYIGSREFDGLVAGDETQLAFGPIDGLRLDTRTLDRTEGDRGVISRTNSERRVREVELRNLTDEDWSVEYTGQIPTSQHEDLYIGWDAAPPPTTENADNRRGLMRWVFELPAGDTWTMQIETEMSWPDNKVLR
ncbi:MAG: DUF4139 domain-containing protein [Paracoccaceae bacterium]